MSKPAKGGFYAVMEGRKPGVYLTWEDCEAQVKGYPNPKYKKFTNATEAEGFVKGSSVPATSISNVSENPSSSHVDTQTTYSKGKKRAISPNVEDESGWDVVYSDGACKGNGKVISTAGVGVWWGEGDPRNIAERCPGEQTNNRAELIAILRILETTPRSKKPLLIKSDSQYSIKCFKEWLPGWQRNGWKKKGGEPVKNAGIIRYLSAQLDARARFGQKIRLQYVKGHSGEQGNDGADAQANLGALLPDQPEKDWTKLERDLVKRVEEEWKNKKVKPLEAPMEVEGATVDLPTENPMKIRKANTEVSSSQSSQISSKSPDTPASLDSTTGPTRQISKSLTPRDVETPPKLTSFKPAKIASPLPERRETVKPEHLDQLTPAKITSVPTQIKQSSISLSASKHSKDPPPKTPSRTPQVITPDHTKSSPMKPGIAKYPVSPLRNVHTVATRDPVTPDRSVKAARVQASLIFIAEAKSSRHSSVGHSGITSVVVNKEDVDFKMFEDCAIDDEDMWKDLWP